MKISKEQVLWSRLLYGRTLGEEVEHKALTCWSGTPTSVP